MTRDQHDYFQEEGLSLRDRFYRLGELARVTYKEIPETWAAFQRFKRVVPKDGKIIEIGAGHGLLSALFAMSGAATALAIDKRYENSVPVGITTLLKFRPYLANYVSWEPRTLHSHSGLESVDAILAIHGCGDLTDFVLRAAVRQGTNVGVMPCCHGQTCTGSKRICSAPHPDFSEWGLSGETAIDVGRVWWLREQGYHVRIAKVRAGVTGQPRIITGQPFPVDK